jgi:hypothetical protein
MRTDRAYLMVLARYLSSVMAGVGVVFGVATVATVAAEGAAAEGAEEGLVREAGIGEVVTEVVMPTRLPSRGLVG